ncbi:Zinc finger protein sfp1 [Zancudomyces culisetae]|uniref:Zinc finger protein sfp1 n=1 Tax=Zancudomyces culisetae TaxID=1213189 RepID=A0A1R1PGC9_ZANCU|nr:Zinc finger protein sfp1 [Zancudomyces culisetae]|eukprot:OMH80031.1 Zinc finger protein sfp1 [Zancudomyces culisetae]
MIKQELYKGTEGSTVDCNVYEDDFYYPRNVEENFCKDFSCCGLTLADLHDLLQHYEECHVRFEEDNRTTNTPTSSLFNESWNDTTSCFLSGADVPISFSLSETADFLSPTTTVNNSNDLLNCVLDKKVTNVDVLHTDGALTPKSKAVASQQEANDVEKQATKLKAFFDTLSSSLSAENVVKKGTFTEKLMSDGMEFLFPAISENTPPLSPSLTTTAPSLINSPTEGPLIFEPLMLGNKRRMNDFPEDASFKKTKFDTHQGLGRSLSTFPGNGTFGSTFASTALSLYDDDIISALTSSTDPLFLVKDNKTTCDVKLASTNVQEAETESEGEEADAETPKTLAKSKSSRELTSVAAGFASALANARSFDLKRLANRAPKEDKPFKCLVPGCDKSYKNPNGLKYHSLHGHCMDDPDAPAKPFKCLVPGCMRTYKNLNGLKYHIIHTHAVGTENFLDFEDEQGDGLAVEPVA